MNKKLIGSAQSASKKGNAINVMTIESCRIMGVSGINLDKKGNDFVRIAKNRGLEKASLIQLKMINLRIIFGRDLTKLDGRRKVASGIVLKI